MRRTWKPLAIAALMALAGASMLVQAQQPVADIVLTGGKVITVDEKFSIAQAVAIRGARIWPSAPTSRSTRWQVPTPGGSTCAAGR